MFVRLLGDHAVPFGVLRRTGHVGGIAHQLNIRIAQPGEMVEQELPTHWMIGAVQNLLLEDAIIALKGCRAD